MSFYKYQSAIGGEKGRVLLVLVCMVYYRLRGTVCGDFSVSLQRKNTRAGSFHHCFTILRSCKCGLIYTRFHTFYVHINVDFYIHAFLKLYDGEKQVC